MNSVITYWDNQYSTNHHNHTAQNTYIAQDFLRYSKEHAEFDSILHRAKNIVDIGCGTGEFCKLLFENYYENSLEITGLDLSECAVSLANSWYKREGDRKLHFRVFNLLKEEPPRSELLVCSNVLEHFKEPFPIIDKLLSWSENIIIITPYDQDLTDGYDGEGGAGHVFSFKEETYSGHDIVDSFKFFSNGWTFGSGLPLQYAVLMKGK